MYSIIFTAAIFVAILINDVIHDTKAYLVSHSILGLIALVLVTVLWYLNYEFVGWALILIPITALFISYLVLLSNKKPAVAAPAPAPAPKPSENKSSDSAPMCIQNPGGPYTTVPKPESSTVSLPASAPPPATSTSYPTNTPTNNSMKISPITGGC